MRRKTLALMAMVLTGASLVTNSATAQTRVLSSDATAQFLPLEVSKSVVIHLPRDVADMLVTTPEIVNVVPRTARRVFVIAKGVGQTNVYFYDAQGKQIEALDISVMDYPVSARVPPGPESVVTVFRGPARWRALSCTQTANLSEGAGCYAHEDQAATLDSLPKGSSVTMPVGH
jgi:Pilus formation protein N terminal region